MSRIRHWAIVCGIGVMAVAVGGSVGGADERLSQYFEGLRARRMFTVAEGECLRRIGGDRRTSADRANLAIELSRTFAAHATFATGDEREELWSRAETIIDQLLQAEPTTPFRVLLESQRAMVPAARGAQLRWQGELFPLDETRRKRAETALRNSLGQLQPLPVAIEDTLRTVLSTRYRPGDEAHEPAPARLHRLSRAVEFSIATASLDLAKVLPSGADQTATLLAADGQFEALTKIARPDGIAWQSRVHRLDILRLRGQGDRLAGRVVAMLKSDPPISAANAAVAVHVRSRLDDDHPDEALVLLEEHRRDHGLDAEELQALIVETLLAARRLAREKSDAALATELLSKAEAVDAKLSGPWGTRSRLLLDQVREEDRYGAKLAGSIREAQWAWQNGNVEGAISAYGRAAAEAHQQGRADLAVEFAFNRASAQVEAGQNEAAAKSLGELLQAYPDDKRAADADLLRTYTLGRLFEQQPSEERKSAYRAALTAHRTKFADKPTAVEATWMLARLVEYEQDWERALELLAGIPNESPHKPAAMTKTAVLFERVIDDARKRGEPSVEWETRAIQTLSAAVAAFPPAPSRLTKEQADVSWRLAKILLHRTPPDFAAADRLLNRVTSSGQVIEREQGELDANWQSLVAGASQLRIVSLAGQGRLADARTMLEQVAAAQPGRMLDILNGLTDAAADIGLEHRAGIGRLQLELAEQLKAQQRSLPDDQKRSLDLALAQANAAIGQWQAAAQVYEELLWKQPKDGDIVEALATLYEECGSPSCLRQAVKQWRTLESLQRKGSAAWLESRYHMALCSHRLGEDETARKLIGVTRVLYPDLGTPALAARYEALAKELGKSGTR